MTIDDLAHLAEVKAEVLRAVSGLKLEEARDLLLEVVRSIHRECESRPAPIIYEPKANGKAHAL